LSHTATSALDSDGGASPPPSAHGRAALQPSPSTLTSMVGTQQPSVGYPIIARTEMEFCDKVHEFFSSTHDVDVNIRTISQRITSPANVSEKDRLSILHQDTRFDVIDFNIGVVRIIKKNGRGASSS
jgi:hypothetical protein